MAKQTLTIEGITFPKFSRKSSKRNFRLIFYIAYKDKTGKSKTTIVIKPAKGDWQWKKSSEKFYLAEAKELKDSYQLDVSALRFDANGFSVDDYKITEIDGDIEQIAVQFIDVKNSSFLDFIKSKVLPDIIDNLKVTGFNPIDLLPVPGVITGIVKDKVNMGDLADSVEDYLKKEKKDKVLNRLSKKYNGKNPFTMSGKKEWEKGKTGTYGVKIGFE